MKRRAAVRSGLIIVASAVLDACRNVGLLTRPRVSYRSTFESASYNRLLGVDDAHRRFQAIPEREMILERGLSIVARHKQSSHLGLFLLHRHFPCPSGTIMLEHAARGPSGEWLYITAPTATSRSLPPYAPSRFMFVRDNGSTSLVPIEYSTDSAVVRHWQNVTNDKDLLTEMAGHLEATGVRDVLGLAVVPREHEGANQVLLEDTIVEPPQSIVRWVFPTEVDPLLTIPTVWSVQRADGCCTLQVVCVFCFGGDGRDHGCVVEHIGCV